MAGTDKLTIANMGLSMLGKDPISDFDEGSPASIAISIWYDFSRQQMLESLDWTFARKSAVLATHADAADGLKWAYRYVYPVDCLKARYIKDWGGGNDHQIPFELITDLTGEEMTIQTNMDQAELVYTFDQKGTRLYTPAACVMLAAAIAANVAFTLTGEQTIKADMLKSFGQLRQAASGSNANEGTSDPRLESEMIRARR